MPAESFGVKVRERRTLMDMSQEELAERVGISRNYLSQIERGQATNLSWHLVQRISSLLDLKTEDNSDSLGLPMRSKELPEGLHEFATEAKLREEEIKMLANLQYRGKRPTSAQQWKILYNIIKAAIESQA